VGENAFVYVLICLLFFKVLLMGFQKFPFITLVEHPEASKLGGVVVRGCFLVGKLALICVSF
jgi:hypothetical protein